MFLNNFISLESNDETKKTSIRRYLYGTVENFDFLSKAVGAEKHEYWYLENDKGHVGLCKVIDLQDTSQGVKYGLVLKPTVDGEQIRIEKEVGISNEEFDAFKNMCSDGMLRDSYFFELENSELKWKVDCFASDNKGELYSNVVRLSIKDWPVEDDLPTTPVELKDSIEEKGSNLEGEQKEIVDKLYNEIFLVKETKEAINDPIEEETPEENDIENSSSDESDETKEEEL